MGSGLEITLVFVIFLGLLALGMSVPFAITLPGILYLYMHGGLPAFRGLGLVTWGSMNRFTLTAVPLFILMAEIMQQSGLSSRIYRGLAKIVSRVPGGLLQTNIVGCAVFAATTGSSVATAASIGSVALPQLIERKYDRKLSAGSLAAGGTLGILFPPSLAMIIYGSFTDTSVPRLFMAGVIPGLMLTAMFMIYIGIHAKLKPEVAPVILERLGMSDIFRAMTDVLPFLVLISGTMGGMYAGVITPTEAGAIGCLVGIVISRIWGDLTWKLLFVAIRRTVRILGNILFIIYSAYLFSYAISYAGVGEEVTSFLTGLKLSRFEFFIALFLLFTVLGCLIESLGMLVLTVPLLYPVLGQYGIDPIWFGIIVVLFIELGQISPPIGINLFVIQSIWDGKLKEVVIGTIPFHLIMFLLLFLLMIFPELALWLPSHMTAAP